jgi:hypothetical protein
MTTLAELLDSLDYSMRSFDKEKSTSRLWQSPAIRIPAQWTDVEVITYNGKQKLAKFSVDNNWGVPGYPHDLFNRDIALWRYTDTV